MPLPRIRVSANQRFLMTEHGEPFFWLGDTAWELFHRLSLPEAEHYLDVRRQQGFNLIQAVALAELDGLHTPNANGHIPLAGDDPTRPNEFYFRHVDAIIRMAAEKRLYIGLLPTWGDKVHARLWGIGPVIFNTDNARIYGRFLGERYRSDPNIIWILGGDRPPEGYEDVWTAMAQGITEGLGFKPLVTYHPMGGTSSSAALHDADWLDMNMLQSGHHLMDAPNWEMIRADYARTPVKPVLDGESNYEHHPVDPYTRPWKPAYGRFTDYDVRKQAYRSVFAGARGFTYGSHSVWQMYAPKHEPVNHPSPMWDEAIFAPGARQLIHLKNLMLSRPYITRIPAPDMLPEVAPLSLHVEKDDCINPIRAACPVATRDSEGAHGLVYFPLAEQTLTVDLRPLRGHIRASWFDPRSGGTHPIGGYERNIVTFTSPIAGPDWILILDAESMTQL
jgi:hypothetical protein